MAVDLQSSPIEWERELLSAIFRADTARMTELMAPDGFGFDATMGLVRQDDLIRGIGALSAGASFAMEQVTVREVGQEVFALAYVLRQWGSFGGAELPQKVHCTSVWSVVDGLPQAMFHHETEAAAERAESDPTGTERWNRT